ncbi:hypothetical protein ADUPG1_005346, partial [Aduncisulcus paluster]
MIEFPELLDILRQKEELECGGSDGKCENHSFGEETTKTKTEKKDEEEKEEEKGKSREEEKTEVKKDEGEKEIKQEIKEEFEEIPKSTAAQSQTK